MSERHLIKGVEMGKYFKRAVSPEKRCVTHVTLARTGRKVAMITGGWQTDRSRCRNASLFEALEIGDPPSVVHLGEGDQSVVVVGADVGVPPVPD